MLSYTISTSRHFLDVIRDAAISSLVFRKDVAVSHGSEAIPLIRPVHVTDKLAIIWHSPWHALDEDYPLERGYRKPFEGWYPEGTIKIGLQWHTRPKHTLEQIARLDYDLVVPEEFETYTEKGVRRMTVQELLSYDHPEAAVMPVGSGIVRFRQYIRLRAPRFSIQQLIYPKGYIWTALVSALDLLYPVREYDGRFSISDLFIPQASGHWQEQPIFLQTGPQFLILLVRGKPRDDLDYDDLLRKDPDVVQAFPRWWTTKDNIHIIKHPATGSEIRIWSLEEAAAVAEIDGIIHVMISPYCGAGRNTFLRGYYGPRSLHGTSYAVAPSYLKKRTHYPLPQKTISYYANLLQLREQRDTEEVIPANSVEEFYNLIQSCWRRVTNFCEDFNSQVWERLKDRFSHTLLLNLDPEEFFAISKDGSQHLRTLRLLCS